MNKKLFFSSASEHWATPDKVRKEIDHEFAIDYDPCPLRGDGGLSGEWGRRVFINPPYGPKIGLWLFEALGRLRDGRIDLAVFLLPVRTDTKWFHTLVIPNAQEIRFLKGRLHFNDLGPAPFPSMLIVFKRRVTR